MHHSFAHASVFLLMLLPFKSIKTAYPSEPVGVQGYSTSNLAFCDELGQILAGMKDNFNALKGTNMGTRTNFWNSKLNLSNTRSNYIFTQFDFKGQPLTNEYYAVISEETNPALQNTAIDNLARYLDGCSLSGYTKTAKQTGLSQFSDDPELEKNAGKKITWTNVASKTSIELSAYYDVVTQKHRVAAIFKAPYNPLVLPTKSDRSTTTAKFTIVNLLAEEANGYWLDFDGKEVYYFNLKHKQQVTMDSYIGHVWRIRSVSNKNILKTSVVRNAVETLELK